MSEMHMASYDFFLFSHFVKRRYSVGVRAYDLCIKTERWCHDHVTTHFLFVFTQKTATYIL